MDVTSDAMAPEQEGYVPPTKGVPLRGPVEEVLQNPRVRLAEVQRLLTEARTRGRPER